MHVLKLLNRLWINNDIGRVKRTKARAHLDIKQERILILFLLEVVECEVQEILYIAKFKEQVSFIFDKFIEPIVHLGLERAATEFLKDLVNSLPELVS